MVTDSLLRMDADSCHWCADNYQRVFKAKPSVPTRSLSRSLSHAASRATQQGFYRMAHNATPDLVKNISTMSILEEDYICIEASAAEHLDILVAILPAAHLQNCSVNGTVRLSCWVRNWWCLCKQLLLPRASLKLALDLNICFKVDRYPPAVAYQLDCRWKRQSTWRICSKSEIHKKTSNELRSCSQ